MKKPWYALLRPARPATTSRRARNRRRLAIEALETRQLLSTVYTVTTSADSGTGSLRDAVNQANTLAPNTAVTIDFSIGTGAQTIELNSALPTLANPITIDGTTQPGYAGRPLIQVDGQGAGAGAVGFSLDDDSHNSVIEGLEITGFNGGGIYDNNGNANVFTNDIIGLHYNGTLPRVVGNGTFGIELTDQANGNTISHVVIAGNQYNGVVINNSMNDTVTASDIGTDLTGEDSLDRNGAALGNGVSGGGGSGFVLNGGANHDTISNNVIVNNQTDGVNINSVGTSANVLTGNHIGIDLAGTTALRNVGNGVSVLAGASGNFIGQAGNGNVISGNGQYGVLVSGVDSIGDRTSFNTVAGNLIGTNATGKAAVPNAIDGVVVSGGAISNSIGSPATGTGTVTQTGGNVISGNSEWGVYISDSGTNSNVVQNDYIGTDITGKVAVANGFNGLDVVNSAANNTVGGTTVAVRNVISGNANEGLLIGLGANKNVVEGNYIGTDYTGTVALPNVLDGVYVGLGAVNNTIGNPSATSYAQYNVISGNGTNGILVTDSGTSGTTIDGNFIGTNAGGTAAVPNKNDGVLVLAGTSGTTIGAGSAGSYLNFISGNAANGIEVDGAGPGIYFTSVGTDVTGQKAIGNGGNGLLVNGVAGTNLQLDAIANNAGYGILTTNGATNNSFRDSNIYNNALGGILEQGNPSLQPAPQLTSVTSVNGQTTITGSIFGSPSKSTQLSLDFFASPYSSSAASIQGKTYIGAANVTTDANGNVTFTVTISATVPAGQIVTATSSLGLSATSQFSNAVTVPATVTSTATFLKADATTQGNWIGVYGTNGYDIVTNPSTTNPNYLPAGVTVTPAGQTSYTWANPAPTTAKQALEVPPSGTSRIAATWYSATSFTVDVNVASGSYNLELYFLDYNGGNARSEQIQFSNASTGAVLSTQTVSSFSNGAYMNYTISGNVLITITKEAGANAVLSGLFLDPSHASTPTITWANPANIVYGTALSATQLDATASVPGTFTYTPAAGTVLKAGNGQKLSVTFTPTDTTDYTTATATAVINVLQATPTITWANPANIVYGTALSKTQLDATSSWTVAGVTGSVAGTFTYTPAAGTVLAVGNDQALSVSFTPTDTTDFTSASATAKINVTAAATAAATFLKQDTTTQGNWIGVYGTDGYDIINNPSTTNPNYLPAGVTVTPAGQTSYTWANPAPTTAKPALEVPPSGTSRIAACWYSATSFTVDVNVGSGSYNLELYFLDYNGGNARSEQIQFSNASTGAVLSTQTVSSFSNGAYMNYTISGNVLITITKEAGANAVLSGLFFDAAPPAGGGGGGGNMDAILNNAGGGSITSSGGGGSMGALPSASGGKLVHDLALEQLEVGG